MTYFKDTQSKPFYDPSEAVIAKHNLTPISEEEFNSIVVVINTPTLEQLADQVRSQRNALIADTDYLVMPDYPITTEQLTSVQEYRQLLRDVTKQVGFPTTIDWPTKPEGV